MAKHIIFSHEHHGPAVADEWLAATAAATQYVGKIAGMAALAVKLGPGFAAEAGTAQYSPALFQIQVDTDVMLPGVKPEDVLPADELFRARHPLFIGALTHEAAHARYSRWVPKDLPFTARMIDILIMLEESRIEKRMLRRRPSARTALGSVVFDLIGKDFKVADTAYGASVAAALTLARVDAGSILPTEAKPFRAIIAETLDDATLDTLRGLWCEYHAMPFIHGEPLDLELMESIARRWLEALGMDADSSDDSGDDLGFMGEGIGEGDSDSAGDGTSERIRAAAASAKHSKDMASEDEVGRIKAARRAAQREADNERRAQAVKAASDAFGAHGAGPSHGTTSHVRWRKPSDRERAAGVRLSRLLEKVIYSDRRVAKARQVEPGGRMHGRGQVQRAAQKAAGQHASAAGWVAKKRTHVDEPRIRVGVMLDVSGSMHRQAAIAGSLAYAAGNAVERVGGDFAMTIFGENAQGLIKPGQKLEQAPVIAAVDGWENFTDGFHALDGALDLVNGDGLRVLILLSDGVFVKAPEMAKADAVLPMLANKGVVIIHVDLDGNASEGYFSGYNPKHNSPYPTVVIPSRTDAVAAVNIIGEHLLDSIKKFKGEAA